MLIIESTSIHPPTSNLRQDTKVIRVNIRTKVSIGTKVNNRNTRTIVDFEQVNVDWNQIMPCNRLQSFVMSYRKLNKRRVSFLSKNQPT